MKKQNIIRLVATILVSVMMLTMFASCESLQGTPGKDGVDGVTPTIEISADGYWIINGVKSEYKAIGTDGKDGKDGKNGTNGKDGVTPAIEISEDGYWIINGVKSNVKATPDSNLEEDENPQSLAFYRKNDGTYAVGGGNAIMLSEILIPSTYNGKLITEIIHHGFSDCSGKLENITIPDSVTSIGDFAFSGCYGLTSITIPDSVTSIGARAFLDCTNLTSVNIPDCVTNIEYATFANCSGLETIVIPDSIDIINSFAFSDCYHLTSINYEGTVEQWNSIYFGGNWNANVPATEVICSDGTVKL